MAGLVLILASITFWAGSSQAQDKIQVGQEVVILAAADARNLDDDDTVEEVAPVKKREARAVKNKVMKGFGALVSYNLAKEFDVAATGGGSSIAGTQKVDSGLGVGFHYMDIPVKEAGSFITLDYELRKKVGAFSGTLDGVPLTVESESKISYFVLSSNLAFGISSEAFLYGGINLPFGVKVTDDDSKYTGALGFQFGAGRSISDTVFISGEYRILNVDTSYTDSGVTITGDYEMSGLVLRLGSVF